jgi:histidinol-phosphate aminotransferase
MSLIVRPGIMEIAPYVPGEAELPGSGPIYKMSSNESALGPSPAAIEAYRSLSGELHRYPDGGATKLREAIAASIDVDPAQIICGAGSDDVLVMLMRAYAGVGDEVLYSRHGFLVYALAAQSVGAKPVAAPEKSLRTDVDALLAAVTPKTRICFVAEPNNPTGSYVGKAEIARLRRGLPENVLLVLDAAYAEYVDKPDYESGIEMVRSHDNVVTARTFSKIYGLAGLRLGWGFCPKPVIDVLNRIRGPFNTPAPSQAAGIAALGDHEHVRKSKAYNDYWLPWFTDRVTEIGLKAHPSVANFMLVQFPKESKLSADDAEAFLKSRRVLVRKMGAYGLGDCLRVTIAEEPALRACATALSDFVQKAATQ